MVKELLDHRLMTRTTAKDAKRIKKQAKRFFLAPATYIRKAVLEIVSRDEKNKRYK